MCVFWVVGWRSALTGLGHVGDPVAHVGSNTTVCLVFLHVHHLLKTVLQCLIGFVRLSIVLVVWPHGFNLLILGTHTLRNVMSSWGTTPLHSAGLLFAPRSVLLWSVDDWMAPTSSSWVLVWTLSILSNVCMHLYLKYIFFCREYLFFYPPKIEFQWKYSLSHIRNWKCSISHFEKFLKSRWN